MFSSTLVWVGFWLFLLIVVIFYNTPRAKEARARSAEKYRRQEEARKEKERLEEDRKARQMENFRKQCLVVYIRDRDGRKSSFEAVLIRMLLRSGITVESLPENNGRAVAGGDISSLKDGLLALVGTSWHKEGTGTDKEGTGTDYEYGFTYKWERTYCDYRLLATGDNGAGKILGAGCEHSSASRENTLAENIIKDLASTLPETS